MVKRILLCALVVVECVSLKASTEFNVIVTNALNEKSRLVADGFTNYIYQCACQNTNVEMSLSASIISGFSQLEMFDRTMDETCLAAAFHSVSNALTSPALATNQWQYWHAEMLHIACLNTDNDKQGAYLVASNAWNAIQSINYDDSSNIVSRALLKYYGIGDDVTIKSAVALNKALSAGVIGKTNECNELKPFLMHRLKQELEDFLED